MGTDDSRSPHAEKKKDFERLRLQAHVTVPTLLALHALNSDSPSAVTAEHAHARDFFPASPPTTPEFVIETARISPTPSPSLPDLHNKAIPTREEGEKSGSIRETRSKRPQSQATMFMSTHHMITRNKRKLLQSVETFENSGHTGRTTKVRKRKKRSVHLRNV
ncbi:hypothetical protein BS50DRAFT_595049 [Corynespora cassiicola Philippines]|uniref:Uncharacterized protein n=1 Tax=Corynespora cassiicola Philippines TaxID=1448308 RepID=A0A2T2N1N1_CORCC|nr:hypothetical protein BS50DRAFT_595049 [Corynespora cassiicola Philippines]